MFIYFIKSKSIFVTKLMLTIFKNPIFLSILSALLLWVSWPDSGISPVIFIAFVPLLLFEKIALDINTKHSNVFGVAYLTFVLWNILCTWWIKNASFGGAALAILANALVMTLFFILYHWMRKKHGASLFMFIPIWLSFEYLHFHWDLAWPWLSLGNVFSNQPHWIQWYEYTGMEGGTLWILLVNVLICQAITSPIKSTANSNIRFLKIIGIIIIPISISFGIYERYTETSNPLNIVIVQPNIDPYNEKFGSMSSQQQVQSFITLAESKITDHTNLVVGPETALPWSIWLHELEDHPDILLLKEFLEKHKNASILIGASTNKLYFPDDKKSITARKLNDENLYYDSFNSALLLRYHQPIQVYHKSRLVPGVEKMPYPFVFGFLEDYALDMGGTSGSLGTEPEPKAFTVNDTLYTVPAICYESVFGDYIASFVRNNCGLICILTNDGWWGNTPGYKQHLSYARIRAIETRRSIARSANTGISAIINQKGELDKQTNWWTKDVIEASVNINQKLTFYVKHPALIYKLSVLFLVSAILFLALNRKKLVYKN